MNWENTDIIKSKKIKKEVSEIIKPYKKKCKFLVDENLGLRVVEYLKGLKWNVKYIGDYNLVGHPDEAVYGCAWKEKRILLTQDDDFLDNKRFPMQQNYGAIVFNFSSEDELISEINNILSLIGNYEGIYAYSKYEVFSDGRIKMVELDRETNKNILREFKITKDNKLFMRSDD